VWTVKNDGNTMGIGEKLDRNYYRSGDTAAVDEILLLFLVFKYMKHRRMN